MLTNLTISNYKFENEISKGKIIKKKINQDEKLLKENKRLKNENNFLISKLNLLEKQNQELKSKDSNLFRIIDKIIQDFEYLFNEYEKNYFLTRKKIDSDLEDIVQSEKLLDFPKLKIFEKPFNLNDDLFIGDENDIDGFVCYICLNIVDHPIECVKCETLYCEYCYNNQSKFNDFCPSCKNKPFVKKKINRITKYFLEKLQFNCPINCGEIFKYSNKEDHKIKCKNTLEIILCNLCKKEIKIEENFKDKHIAECDQLKITCSLCKNIFIKFDYKSHLETCGNYYIYCYECKISFPRINKDSHDNFYCEVVKNQFIKFSLFVNMLKELIKK